MTKQETQVIFWAAFGALLYIGAQAGYFIGVQDGSHQRLPLYIEPIPSLLQGLAWQDDDGRWHDATMRASFIEDPDRPRWSTVRLER